jgi:hypothetical protein
MFKAAPWSLWVGRAARNFYHTCHPRGKPAFHGIMGRRLCGKAARSGTLKASELRYELVRIDSIARIAYNNDAAI